MTPEDRLQGKEQGCTEGGEVAEPAFGDGVKCEYARKVGEVVNEMAKIRQGEGQCCA